VRGQKLEKFLSNHKAQNKGGCIYAPIVVFLLKHKKANMRKSEFLMLEALKSAPHLNDMLECAHCFAQFSRRHAHFAYCLVQFSFWHACRLAQFACQWKLCE
jgi:hypothetical protein